MPIHVPYSGGGARDSSHLGKGVGRGLWLLGGVGPRARAAVYNRLDQRALVSTVCVDASGGCNVEDELLALFRTATQTEGINRKMRETYR